MVPILADTLVASDGVHTSGTFVANVHTGVGALIDILADTSDLSVPDLALALPRTTDKVLATTLRIDFTRGRKLSYIGTLSNCRSSQVVASHGTTLITSNRGNNDDKKESSHFPDLQGGDHRTSDYKV